MVSVDWDLIFFCIWMVLGLFAHIYNKNKKKNLPPPTNSDLDQIQQNSEPAAFEIPTLANDPNIQVEPLPSREVVEVEQVNNVDELFRQRQEMYRQKLAPTNLDIVSKIEEPRKKQPQKQSNSPINLDFTPEDAINAMILSEIFNKPKSLQRR